MIITLCEAPGDKSSLSCYDLPKFAKSIFQDIHLILDVSDQASDGCLIIDHINTLGVGIVAHRERARNCPSKFPVKIKRKLYKVCLA